MVEPRGPVLVCAGREFHVREHEGDAPPVVLMSGCGLAMEYWREVNRRLGDRRVLAYDRPGMGGTEWPGKLPTLAQEVASLADLFDQQGIRGAVLVAHSMASFHAEALARLHPELVSGVVMVDGSVEWYTRRPVANFRQVPSRLRTALRLGHAGPIGGYVWRLGTWFQSNRGLDRLGFGRIPAIYRDPDSLVMATAESIAYARQGWDLLQLRPDHRWSGIPTVMLTAGRDEAWIASQARYAELLGGRQVVVEESKHLMMLDCPDVIVDAVRSLSNAAG